MIVYFCSSTYVAVTETFFAGIVNVVVELVADANATPLDVVHFENTLCAAGAFAVIVIVSPAYADVLLAEPLLTVIVYFCSSVYVAVTETFFAGIVNVVVMAVASVNTTSSLSHSAKN